MSSSFYSQIGIPSTSSTAIESSVNQAATSETNAAASATSSATSASAASASAVSANAADVSATQAKNDAETAASAAAGHSQQASAHVSTALNHANTASNHEQAALASANNASQHSSNASTFATNSSNSATASATSAADSATSATNSATSATASAASATSAAASLSTFQNQYLGASATAPTQDPDGSSLDLGDLYFDTAANVMKVYSDSGWINASSSVNGTSERQTYTATAGQTTFNVTYDAGYVDVWLNGAKLLAGTDFTATSGTDIVLASPAAANDIVDIIAFGTFVFTQSDHYTKTQSDARYVASSSLNGDIDTHLNQSSATSGQYLEWNGSDYAWSAVPAGYTDSDVDAHLLTSGITLDATNDRLGIGDTTPEAKVTVVETQNDIAVVKARTTATDGRASYQIGNDADNWFMGIDGGNSDAFFIADAVGSSDRLVITGSGNVGISDSAPSEKLNVAGNVMLEGGDQYLYLTNAGTGNSGIYVRGNTSGSYLRSHSTGSFTWEVTGSEKMRIDSSGNVGIGATSITSLGTGITTLELKGNSASQTDRSGGIRFTRQDGTHGMSIYNADGASYIESQSTYPLLFSTNGSERMRLDSGGDILIGKTANNNTTQGIKLDGSGYISACIPNDYPLILNRQSSDGDIAHFRKDGNTVGAIASRSGLVLSIVLDPRSGGMGLSGSQASLLPTDHNGTPVNNSKDLGSSSNRWDDIYATNSTIQTSDEREKQQIASLTDAEMTAAKAISKLFKTFKWNDKVEAKGDAARTHTGVIAQEVETAMSNAGLDASNYAFWCSDTWWETETEVAAIEAVEAQDAVYDDDGNLVTEAVEGVEGKEAYTRTDTYYTQEEAPEGATERNRKGIRYPELLSFIGAATEQRLANLETRVEALEAN